MKYTSTPLRMDLTQHFDTDTGAQECKRLLHKCVIKSTSTMVEALSHALEITEDALCMAVRDLLSKSGTQAEIVSDE